MRRPRRPAQLPIGRLVRGIRHTEDETGIADLIVWRDVLAKFRSVIRLAKAMRATGKVERQGEVVHIHVREVVHYLDGLPGELGSSSRELSLTRQVVVWWASSCRSGLAEQARSRPPFID